MPPAPAEVARNTRNVADGETVEYKYPISNKKYPMSRCGIALLCWCIKNQKGRISYLDIGHWILFFKRPDLLNPCFFTSLPLQYVGEMVILMNMDENSLAVVLRS